MHDPQPPGLEWWPTIKLWAGLVLTWTAGTAGQIAIAGAAGGAVRWWMSRPGLSLRHLLTGAGSVITGAVFAQYFAPITLPVLEKWAGPMGDGGFATAAFAAGLGGMSIAKIMIAAIEGAAGKLGGKDDG